MSKSKADLSAMIRELQEFSEAKNLNQSEARIKILEVIAEEGLHFTVLDLVKKIQKRYPHLGKSTVYRNLPILIESGLVQEGPTDSEGQTLYELAGEDHHNHIICLDCNRIVEFQDSGIERRHRSVTEKMDFSIESHRNTIYSRCKLLATSAKTRTGTKIPSVLLAAAGGLIAASIAVAVSSAAIEMNSPASTLLKSAESAMIQSCRKEFAVTVERKSLDEVDHWAEAQENAPHRISDGFKKTQCYAKHEVWEKLAQRNEWAVATIPSDPRGIPSPASSQNFPTDTLGKLYIAKNGNESHIFTITFRDYITIS